MPSSRCCQCFWVAICHAIEYDGYKAPPELMLVSLTVQGAAELVNLQVSMKMDRRSWVMISRNALF